MKIMNAEGKKLEPRRDGETRLARLTYCLNKLFNYGLTTEEEYVKIKRRMESKYSECKDIPKVKRTKKQK